MQSIGERLPLENIQNSSATEVASYYNIISHLFPPFRLTVYLIRFNYICIENKALKVENFY